MGSEGLRLARPVPASWSLSACSRLILSGVLLIDILSDTVTSGIDDMMEYGRDDVELGVVGAVRIFGREGSSVSGRNVVRIPVR